jgi:hypothetical protein
VENYTSGAFNVQVSTRKSFIRNPFDVEKTLLLVPINESTSASLFTFESHLVPVSTDDIKQSICPSKVDKTLSIKRSVKQLQDTGLLPRSREAIITCPSNVDQICLTLRDDDAPSESVKLQLLIILFPLECFIYSMEARNSIAILEQRNPRWSFIIRENFQHFH